ncbi:MAG: CotH kinase family protein, partial [Candidatus Electryonea clarkiae]|nr:CotH kinase family protein [Candidatus Electryonea clarkiae]
MSTKFRETMRQRFNNTPRAIILSIVCFTLVQPIISFPAWALVINEVMSSNTHTLSDEDSDTPDWIELYNNDNQTINLDGYGLSDDPDEPLKWIFPAIEIDPDDYLLVLASGKNRIEYGGHWENIVNWGDEWKYHVGITEPPNDWNAMDFDDSNWESGASGFGYGDADDSTIVQQTMSVFVRKEFEIEDIEDVRQIAFHIDYDDAFVAYMNGDEIVRMNIGEPGIPPEYDQAAEFPREARIYRGGYPEYFEINLENLREGSNLLAIEVHNLEIGSSDLTLIPFFSLKLAEPPGNPQGIPEILELLISRLHSNFRIDSNGEPLLLSNPQGTIIDSISIGYIPADVSYGRRPDGEANWFLFTDPTPESANSIVGYEGISETPQFSCSGGFYDDDFRLLMLVESNNAVIRYTLNGSTPDELSPAYSRPITLYTTTVVRARAFEPGKVPGRVVTNTYFFDYEPNLPVISLSTNSAHFFDENTGIHVEGDNPDFPNYWEDWEKPIHTEFFELDGVRGFSIDAGVKIVGGWTRTYPQKSLAIFARGVYGKSEFDYPLFANLDIEEYESFVLRNSGNDWELTMFRDGLMTGIVAETGLDIMAYRPAIVFFNGQYWGIYNIREKNNEHFLAVHNNIDPDNIDMLEGRGWSIHGDDENYWELISYIENYDLSYSDNYQHVSSQIDITNYITYQVAQIYFNNRDWPGNNIKYWRPRTPDGKWKWILYDTDFGFDIYNNQGYSFNSLEFATEPDGPQWPNPPWSTFLFRSLLENDEFQDKFINYFCDHLNSTFLADRVLQQISEKSEMIEPEISSHMARWEYENRNWEAKVNVLETFASRRAGFVKTHIRQFFGLERMNTISIDISPSNGGKIGINSMTLKNYPWEGEYFPDVPVQLRAIPRTGYRFVQWE